MTLEKALKYLGRDPVHNINMTEPLRRGTAIVLYAGDDGVLTLNESCSLPSLACADAAAALRLTEGLVPEWDVVVQERHAIAPLSEKYGFSDCKTCYNSAYLKKEPLPLRAPEGTQLRQLGEEYLDEVCRYYENSLSSRDYILDRLASGVVYGAFVNGALAGFIGEHDEGSGGMLEVLPQYRRMGLGTLLETYNINMALQNGKTPFGQFFEENSVSRALQRSMGMEIASEPVFWLTK